MQYKITTRLILATSVFTTIIRAQEVFNPYAAVNWEQTEYIHSFSHQHGNDPEFFYNIGYRHLPISNYYPSKPFYPLSEAFYKDHPDAIAGPNAEQHSCTDMGIHFNVIGGHYSVGYGRTARYDRKKSPAEFTFTNLHKFNGQQEPWRGIYRLDLHYSSLVKGENPTGKLTVKGGVLVNGRTFKEHPEGVLTGFQLGRKTPRTFFFKAVETEMTVRVEYDPSQTEITRFRMMQGTNRPWRDAFRAGLDGDLKDSSGKPMEGLLCKSGGGISINHPRVSQERILELLDFDERVLGVEAWNYGCRFGGSKAGPIPMATQYYDLWDGALKAGRRCWGFFVKDHCRFGSGRNVLLLEGLHNMSRAERECAAMQAYREGRFFGQVAAMHVNQEGKVISPYDYSEFRFKYLRIHKAADNTPLGVECALAGINQELRPNAQLRFITEQGVVYVAEAAEGYFPFPRTSDNKISCQYLRVEGYGFPHTHNQGKPLTQAIFKQLHVGEIAALHDHTDKFSHTYIYPQEAEPVGIVDMVFSQPIMIKAQ